MFDCKRAYNLGETVEEANDDEDAHDCKGSNDCNRQGRR